MKKERSDSDVINLIECFGGSMNVNKKLNGMLSNITQEQKDNPVFMNDLSDLINATKRYDVMAKKDDSISIGDSVVFRNENDIGIWELVFITENHFYFSRFGTTRKVKSDYENRNSFFAMGISKAEREEIDRGYRL